MNLTINHYGRIKAGKVIFSTPDLYDQQLLELEGCEVVINIKKRHKKPSQSQYGYYRGAILIACYQSECFSSLDSKDAVHDEYFAPRFLSYKKLVEVGGKTNEVTLTRSLADISNEEMTKFITQVIACCESELGIEIPSPELFYNKYYQK